MASDDQFTAVVFFHGIGQQRRYESVSGVLQSFQQWAQIQHDESFGQYTTHLEPPSTPEIKKNIAYIETEYGDQKTRFYEVYWAPITAGGAGSLGIFAWLVKQIGTPTSVLRSPWHTRRRLRRAYLYSLWDERYNQQSNTTPLKNLLEQYDTFCDSIDSPRKAGDFAAFLRSLDDPDGGLARLAKEWRSYYLAKEWWNLFVLLTLGMMVIIVPLFVLLPVLRALFYAAFPEMVQFGAQAAAQTSQIYPYLFGILAAAIVPVGFVLDYFLREFVGDVRFWVTYEETDEKHRKRGEILSRGHDTMKHVLHHENCNRVIILSHSLGTPIAMDTLLALGRHNRALEMDMDAATPDLAMFDAGMRGAGGGFPSPEETGKPGDYIPVDKIDYLFTYGSPVDKIHYFFESHRGANVQYEAIVDEVRGDIGTTPYWIDNKPNITWINLWDQSDLISGPLYTPVAGEYRRERRIFNVLVDNHTFPAPIRSHLNYLQHRDIVALLYNTIFRQLKADHIQNIRDMMGENAPLRAARFRDSIVVLLWALPLALLVDNIGLLMNINLEPVVTVLQGIFIVTLAIVFGAAVISLIRGHVKPFTE